MHLVQEEINYTLHGVNFKSYVAYQSSENQLPAILILPDFSGRNPRMCETADMLAKEGYYAIAVDIYGDAKVGKDTEENLSLMQPLIDDRQILLKRLDKALTEAASIQQVDSNKIAAIGFCFGGLCALDMARANLRLKSVISFHGNLSSNNLALNEKIEPAVMVLHGHDDPMVTPESVMSFESEMTQRQADWQVHVYGNTIHAFTNPDADDVSFGVKYNPLTSQRAWQSARAFLTETLDL